MAYMYMLCDPDTEIPFYIGKGSGERIHYYERYLDDSYDSNQAKKRKIRQIQEQGKQVLKKIVAEFENERDTYIYEWSLITLHQEHLTNISFTGFLPERVRINKKPGLDLLRPREVAAMLRMKGPEVRRLAYRGELPFRYVKSEMRFEASDVEAFILSTASQVPVRICVFSTIKSISLLSLVMCISAGLNYAVGFAKHIHDSFTSPWLGQARFHKNVEY